MTGKDKIDKEQFFPLADSNYGLRGHSLKIRKDRSTWISESTYSANEWSTHGINSLNMSWTRRPSTHLTGWTTSGKIWTLQAALLNKSIIVQVQVQVSTNVSTSPAVISFGELDYTRMYIHICQLSCWLQFTVYYLSVLFLKVADTSKNLIILMNMLHFFINYIIISLVQL